ncbi:hypothetical protein IDSA_04490 [Pseudidiomarina salinarum]|uniref:ABC transporter substrate-binding protein n=1 Tax=Pseudidiomarina salinarum TaxID=435908 RepID=A0A094IW77_9GAMM|nr:ABC transporter substrate-binding protein [Pseudidiomarina salinarum]KFZ31940.1 hypothetical protein IDSA_04490 [Pseudidiomarina salinarum]RUO70283.1 ABC transporter substrate-binding protein [Pseudidiomarina salinarum]
MASRLIKVLLCCVLLLASKGVAAQVYFYAWGGSSEVNNYLRWAADELKERHDIELIHVKVGDISEAVARLLNEDAGSSAIDLLWINGENFHALKRAGKLLGDLPARVDNAAAINPELNWRTDFGVAVDGYELPWGVGQFHLLVRENTLPAEPDPAQILTYAQQHPGRLTYPKPPEFHGTTFLKSVLISLNNQDERLYTSPDPDTARELLAPLWRYLDALHPLLWRQGRDFPGSAVVQQQLLANGQLDMAVSFNPQELTVAQRQQRLPASVTATTLGSAAITNSHYLAIPAASPHQPEALQVINFLLSERAQLKKMDPAGWGDPPVIELNDSGPQALQLFSAQSEPHVDWLRLIEQQWLERYQR